MAKKKTVVSEVASALGTAAARVENLKPRRTTATKHSKAAAGAVDSAAPATIAVPMAAQEPDITMSVAPVAAQERMPESEEIALVAYLYWESRGFQGGSPEDDWIRAEQEVRRRRN